MHRWYYALKGVGVFSRKARIGLGSEDLFRSLEEQSTQEAWWAGACRRVRSHRTS